MFEVREVYANRKGNYTVLEINEPKMTVEYEDGSTADLSISIQMRIWQNIVIEREAERVRTSSARKRSARRGTRFYIKPTSMMTVEEFSASGTPQDLPATGKWLRTIKRGDRIIYFAQETQVFFAVVTITGPGQKPKARGRKKASPLFFPLDVDAYVIDLSEALLASAVDLESQPNFINILTGSEDYLEITEDEFELLAEALTEVSELDEDDEDLEDEDDEDIDD